MEGVQDGKIDSITDLNRVDLFDYVPEEDKSVVLEAINEYREDADFGLD